MTAVIRGENTVVVRDGGRGLKGDRGLPGPGGGVKSHWHAEEFGLGDGVTDDRAAILLALGEIDNLFTQEGLDRGGVSPTIEFPAGTWECEWPSLAELYGSTLPVIGPTQGGTVRLVGQGGGATVLRSAGPIDHDLELASATRGVNGGPNFSGNTITLGFAAPHNAVVGHTIALHIISRGRAMWAHYKVIAVPNATHVQYCAGATDDGTGHDDTAGGNLDLLIPPLSYVPGPWQDEVPNVVYFGEYFLDGREFKQPHLFIVENMTLQCGSHTRTPADGYGIHVSSRMQFTSDAGCDGWWMGAVYDGTPYLHPSLPERAQAPQNTDHSWISTKNFTDCGYAELGFIDNASDSYFRRNGMPGLGGGRDNHVITANFGQTKFAGWACNDAGNLETFDITGDNLRGGSYPILWEGVDGVAPRCIQGIDSIVGWIKIEAAANWSLGMDETKCRRLEKSLGLSLRLEAGIGWNGSDTGTPGGSGSTPIGTFPDGTDKPWPCANLSLVRDVDGMPQLTGDVPWAMFGSDGGCDINTIVVFGDAFRGSEMGAPYAEDGRTIVGAAGAALFRSDTAAFTDNDIGLRIESPNLKDGSDTIKDRNSATEVVMDHAITVASTGQEWKIGNDGTETQSGVCHEGLVATVSNPDVDGMCTITVPYPIWDGPDLPGPYRASAGEGGFIRCGVWDIGEGFQALFDTQATDRMCHAQSRFDVKQLGCAILELGQDDDGPTTRRNYPSFRISNAITRRGGNGTVAAVGGHFEFSAPGARLGPGDSGRTLSVDFGAGYVTGTLTAWHENLDTYTVTGISTEGTGLSWKIGAVHNQIPYRFGVRRGQQLSHLYQHDPADIHQIEPGMSLEFTTSDDGNLCVARSTANPDLKWAGIAMGGSRAGATPGVRTTGTVGNTAARVYTNGPTLLVAQYPSILSVQDDPNAFLTNGSGDIHAGDPICDMGDGFCGPVPVSGPYRLIGQAIRSESGGIVGGVLGQGEWRGLDGGGGGGGVDGGTP